MLIRGLRRSQGEFNGSKYDNMLFHCDSINPGNMMVGDPVEVVKVPYAVYQEHMKMTGENPADFIGKKLKPSYNRFGKVTDFEVV